MIGIALDRNIHDSVYGPFAKSFLDPFGVDPRSGHGFETPFPTFAQKIE